MAGLINKELGVLNFFWGLVLTYCLDKFMRVAYSESGCPSDTFNCLRKTRT